MNPWGVEPLIRNDSTRPWRESWCANHTGRANVPWRSPRMNLEDGSGADLRQPRRRDSLRACSRNEAIRVGSIA